MRDESSAWRVKYDGLCSRCGITLRAGEVAVWDRRTRSMHCVECPTEPGATVPPPAIEPERPVDRRAEHDRRAAKRAAGIEAR
jgi:hypothetical protein